MQLISADFFEHSSARTSSSLSIVCLTQSEIQEISFEVLSSTFKIWCYEKCNDSILSSLFWCHLRVSQGQTSLKLCDGLEVRLKLKDKLQHNSFKRFDSSCMFWAVSKTTRKSTWTYQETQQIGIKLNCHQIEFHSEVNTHIQYLLSSLVKYKKFY